MDRQYDATAAAANAMIKTAKIDFYADRNGRDASSVRESIRDLRNFVHWHAHTLAVGARDGKTDELLSYLDEVLASNTGDSPYTDFGRTIESHAFPRGPDARTMPEHQEEKSEEGGALNPDAYKKYHKYRREFSPSKAPVKAPTAATGQEPSRTGRFPEGAEREPPKGWFGFALSPEAAGPKPPASEFGPFRSPEAAEREPPGGWFGFARSPEEAGPKPPASGFGSFRSTEEEAEREPPASVFGSSGIRGEWS